MLENYELVQKGLRILHPLMAKYIGRELRRVYADRWWAEARAALDDQRDLPDSGSDGELIDSLDVSNCLRLLIRRWREVFADKLSKDCRSWANLLMGVRNRTAHIGGQDLGQRDAERALDTMALLCENFDGNGSAEIERLYQKLRFDLADGDEQEPSRDGGSDAVKRNEGVMTAGFGSQLPSWRDVMRPQSDVAEGRYSRAEFAADLAQVSRGEGSPVYCDPAEFFARTCLTAGLSNLLVAALKRLSGRGGEPVIQLKTAFGGGKTHSLLALYHLMGGRFSRGKVPILGPVMERAGVDDLPVVNVAVLVGTALDPAQRRTPDDLQGHEVNTMWGEMAYRLVTSASSPELYSLVEEADRRGVSPGTEKLIALLNGCGPCLVLMDEIVAYAKKLYGVEGLPAGSYDNFITFIQEISEAARASENSLVVASIPESDVEIGGEAGKIALGTIEHTFGRVESIWKPVVADEGFEVVRRRLFCDCENTKARDSVCAAFSKMYRDNASDFPAETKELEYLEKMKSCYPIHPEIFDRLYGDWATLENFQRTRGVLRLMADVIHELWMAGDSCPMIMPGSVPLNTPSVREELLNHLPPTWNSIVDHEVDGANSVPYQKDQSVARYGEKMAARRVARTVMLGSAPSTSALRGGTLRGLGTDRIRLGTVQPGETIADFNDALNTLRDSLSYLYSSQDGKRYWYDTIPTLRKTAADRASLLTDENVTAVLEARLRKLRKESPFGGLHICPASSFDVPDEQSARLVLLRPEDSMTRLNGNCVGKAMTTVAEMLNARGNMPRVYKNMLAFVAADSEKLADLCAEVRRFLAWKSIVDDKVELNLDGAQVREAENILRSCDASVDANVKETYRWLLVSSIDPDEPLKEVQWEISNLGGGSEPIVSKTAKMMEQNEQIIAKWAPLLLKNTLDKLLWKESDDISVKTLWENLCTYSYLPKLACFEVLQNAIVEGSSSKAFFGIAAGRDGDRYVDLKLGKPVSSVNSSDLLVKPEVAQRQIDSEVPPVPFVTPEPNPPEPPSNGTNPPPSQKKPKTRFSMSAKLDNTRVIRNVNDCVNEILRHLTVLPGVNAELTLEVNVVVPDGIPDSTQRTVSENCDALKVNYWFEDG